MRFHNALSVRLFIPALFVTAGLACDGGDPTDPDPEPITVAPLAQQVRQIRTGVVEEGGGSSQVSVLSLADSIVKAMAKNGVPTAPSAVPVPRESVLDNAPVLSMIAGYDDVKIPLDWATEPRVPGGITCVANTVTGWWKGDPTHKYGPVSSEATRFELYEVVGGHWRPGAPSINGFVDIFVHGSRKQASDNGGIMDVLVQGAGGTSDFSFPLGGTSTASILDLVSNGGFFNVGTSTLGFDFTLTNTAVGNSMLVDDLTITAQTSIDFGAVATGLLTVQKDGGQTVAFQFEFDRQSALQTVVGGTVSINNEVVAEMTGGGRFSPIFSITHENMPTTERANLTDLYSNLTALDSRVIDMFTFAHCVGSDDAEICGVMITRLFNVS